MSLFNGSALYIDIHESLVRVVKGSRSKGNISIDGFGSLDLSSPIGRIPDEAHVRELGMALAAYLDEPHFAAKHAHVVLSRDGIITRTARLPAMGVSALGEFLRAEINEFLPIDLSEYEFDYSIIKSFTADDDGKDYYEVLLVAVPRLVLHQTMQLLEMAELNLVSIDVLPNAFLRLFSRAPNQDFILMDTARDGARISIYENGSLILYSDVPPHDLNRGQDITTLLEETRGYVDFFSSRNQGRKPDMLYIMGELTALRHSGKEVFENALAVEICMALDEAIGLKFSGKAGFQFGDMASLYAANIGLMFRHD
ncbi:MAG: type IV pilus biogenesis protein PilM [Acidobacteriota bacterium]